MDWLCCVIGGLFFGALIAFANLFSRWAEEARKDGAIK